MVSLMFITAQMEINLHLHQIYHCFLIHHLMMDMIKLDWLMHLQFMVIGLLKKHTLYKNVKRLGVGEKTVTVDEGKLKFNQFPFEPRKIRDYGDEDHQLYSDLFLDSLKVRGSENGNVVYLSSGWDSTSILGGLGTHFYSDKVKAVIGRMRYSERAGTINPFEIERAQKVADYYNVDLNIVDFDYTKDIPNIFSHMKKRG